eukprot:GHVT01035376.1.p1 GENE.GHVT01035376.1~~GHVT01035376.1.p1  ORF type:complete len:729 (-),score=192.72 GHVT01035376.1:152-2338(-)
MALANRLTFPCGSSLPPVPSLAPLPSPAAVHGESVPPFVRPPKRRRGRGRHLHHASMGDRAALWKLARSAPLPQAEAYGQAQPAVATQSEQTLLQPPVPPTGEHLVTATPATVPSTGVETKPLWAGSSLIESLLADPPGTCLAPAPQRLPACFPTKVQPSTSPSSSAPQLNDSVALLLDGLVQADQFDVFGNLAPPASALACEAPPFGLGGSPPAPLLNFSYASPDAFPSAQLPAGVCTPPAPPRSGGGRAPGLAERRSHYDVLPIPECEDAGPATPKGQGATASFPASPADHLGVWALCDDSQAVPSALELAAPAPDDCDDCAESVLNDSDDDYCCAPEGPASDLSDDERQGGRRRKKQKLTHAGGKRRRTENAEANDQMLLSWMDTLGGGIDQSPAEGPDLLGSKGGERRTRAYAKRPGGIFEKKRGRPAKHDVKEKLWNAPNWDNEQCHTKSASLLERLIVEANIEPLLEKAQGLCHGSWQAAACAQERMFQLTDCDLCEVQVDMQDPWIGREPSAEGPAASAWCGEGGEAAGPGGHPAAGAATVAGFEPPLPPGKLPAIRRRLGISPTITLANLHRLVCISMGICDDSSMTTLNHLWVLPNQTLYGSGPAFKTRAISTRLLTITTDRAVEFRHAVVGTKDPSGNLVTSAPSGCLSYVLGRAAFTVKLVDCLRKPMAAVHMALWVPRCIADGSWGVAPPLHHWNDKEQLKQFLPSDEIDVLHINR